MAICRRGVAALALAAVMVYAPRSAAAAQEPLRLELFFKGAFSPPGAAATYEHSYDPHPGYEIPGSYARQTLAIDPLSGGGLRAGLTLSLGKTLGLRLTVGCETSRFGGENEPFEIFYKYTAWLPPMLEKTNGSRLTRVEWPATSGRLQRTSASLELVLRLPLSGAWSLRLSAGPHFSTFGGEIYPLGYEEVIYERYGSQIFGYSFVLLRLPGQTILGVTAEAELALRIDRRVSLILGAAFRTGSYEGTPEIAAAYDYHSLIEQPLEIMDRLRARISPGRISLSSSFLFSVGVAIGI